MVNRHDGAYVRGTAVELHPGSVEKVVVESGKRLTNHDRVGRAVLDGGQVDRRPEAVVEAPHVGGADRVAVVRARGDTDLGLVAQRLESVISATAGHALRAH